MPAEKKPAVGLVVKVLVECRTCQGSGEWRANAGTTGPVTICGGCHGRGFVEKDLDLDAVADHLAGIFDSDVSKDRVTMAIELAAGFVG